MNQPTGWGQPQANWGQPAAPPPPPPQGAVGPQAPQQGFAPPQQPMAPPQAPPGGFAPPAQPNFAGNPLAGLTSGDQTANRNPYLEDGDYKLKVSSIKMKSARQSGKFLFIIETEILQSNNPSRPPGMVCSSFIDLSNRDLAGRHIAGFVTAIHGFDPVLLPKDSPVAPWVEPATGRNMQWGEYAAHAAHDSNPWHGREVGCTVTTIETKAGNDFGLHTWKPANAMVIGAMRAAAPVAPAMAPTGQAGSWGVAPGAPAAAPQTAPATPNWGVPPAQGR